MTRLHGLCILITFLPPLAASSGGCVKPAQERAVAEVERLEGKFEIDEKVSHRPLVKVDLSFTQAADESLARLNGVTTLRELHLCGTKITDEGLERVAGLTNLKILDLWPGQEPPQYGGTRVPAVVPSFVTENVPVAKSIALDVTSVGEHEH